MKKMLVYLTAAAACLLLAACADLNGGGQAPAQSPSAGADAESAAPKSSNALLANTAWTAGDASYMVFPDESNYAWYQNKEVTDDNYFAGTYQFYIGEDALTYLTVNLKEYGVTKDEMQQVFDRNEEYDVENLVCLTADNESFMLQGEEQLEENKSVSYYGFLLQDGTYLDVANMTTGTYYGFTKE